MGPSLYATVVDDSPRTTILNLIYVKYTFCEAKPPSRRWPHSSILVNVLKETTNSSGSQSTMEGSACNTYRTQAECRTRPCWRAEHPACRYVWALSQDWRHHAAFDWPHWSPTTHRG